MALIDDLDGAKILREEDLSKRDLTQMVNEQSDRIKALAAQSRQLLQLALVCAKHPEALAKTTDGVRVPSSALSAVKLGMTLHTTVTPSGDLEVRVEDAAYKGLTPGRVALAGSDLTLRHTKRDGTVDIH